MSKKTFYFPHDCNARNDDKIIAVRMRHKMEGYGVYFAILERLLESSDYMCAKDYNIIAFDLHVSADLVKSIVENFGLFKFTECSEFFYSDSFNDRMKPLENIREQRSLAGKKSAEKRWEKGTQATTVTANSNNRVTTDTPKNNRVEYSKVEYSKVKEKVKEIVKEKTRPAYFSPPSLAEVQTYCTQRNNTVDASRFLNFYQAKDWMIGKNKMKDWQAAIRTWETKPKAENNETKTTFTF